MNVQGKSLVNWLIRAQFAKTQQTNYVFEEDGYHYALDEAGNRRTTNSYENMPQSLCSYFWTALISIVISIPTLPFLYLSYRSNPKNSKSDVPPVALSLVLVAFMLLAGATLWQNWTGITIWSPFAIFVAYLFGLIGLALVVSVGMGLFMAGSFGYDKYDTYKINKRHEQRASGIVKEYKPNWFIEFFKAKKQKVCPMINYTEE
jgi:hypothetical protein